jgi:hypothetical protein
MSNSSIEVSVVMPCLNEADTLATCIGKAFKGLEESGVRGEVIVADNGSSDDSPQIAEDLSARLVSVSQKGYGSALMGGFEAARGEFIIMGDADDSYDFLEIPKFIERLRQGYDLVQGCRLPAGGGKINSGAMPWSHRWIGNPFFSLLVRRWFKAPIHDVYCGMRGFTKAHYMRLQQRCTGMEFATEMIIKSSLMQASIAEVPITLHKDGRIAHPPHLKTVQDGWRTLRFFLMCSPHWLFMVPGFSLVILGLVGYMVALPGLTIFQATLDAHTLLFSSLFILTGYQSVQFAVLSKTFAMNEGMLPSDPAFFSSFRYVSLERGLLFSLVGLLAGAFMLIAAIVRWVNQDFGSLDYAETMRLVIPGATLMALGFQTALSGFFISILGMQRKK